MKTNQRAWRAWRWVRLGRRKHAADRQVARDRRVVGPREGIVCPIALPPATQGARAPRRAPDRAGDQCRLLPLREIGDHRAAGKALIQEQALGPAAPVALQPLQQAVQDVPPCHPWGARSARQGDAHAVEHDVGRRDAIEAGGASLGWATHPQPVACGAVP
jgi:hypothetical protein